MKLSGGGVHPPAEVPRRPAAAATRHDSSVGSVAVLPLTNVNQDEDLEYLSDGLTDSLINNLSLVPHLRVLARSTVFRYKTERDRSDCRRPHARRAGGADRTSLAP